MNILISLLTTSVTMSLIILLAMGLFRFFPKTFSGKTRYLIWIIILLGLIIPFRPLLWGGFITVEPFWQNAATTSQSFDEVEPEVSEQDISQPVETAVTTDAVTTPTETPAPETPKANRFPSLFTLLLILWMTGALISFSRHMINYYQFQKMIKRWGKPVEDLATLELFDIVKESMGLRRKNIGLVRCSMIKTPMLTGFRKPTVLLPEKHLEADELELIFEHELTHYKHKDLYVNLLGTLAVSLHWFNPVVYFCYPSIQGDGEVCCDEAVLINRDLDYRRFYGEVIISMIERHPSKQVAFSTCFYAKKIDLKRRLLAIMETNKTKKISLLAVALVFGLVLISGSIFAFTSPQRDFIGERAARNIALRDAKLNRKNVTFKTVKLDMEDGVSVYDVEFYSGNTEYDYEIDARTGAILEKDNDIENFTIPAENTSNVNKTGNQNKKLISVEEAKKIALKNTGLKAKQVTFVKAKLDNDDGIAVYDIEFYSGNTEYDFEIDATTGAIREKDTEIENFTIPAGNVKNPKNNTTAPKTATISVEKAKEIALKNARLNANQVQFVKAKLDKDDGVLVYDIEFYSGNTEYDYEIDATTGAIREKDLDIENFKVPTPKQNNNSSTQTGNISVERAKQITLTHAGVYAGQVIFKSAKLDREDGREVYEIDFVSGNKEYDYEIDAKSGSILKFDVEIDD